MRGQDGERAGLPQQPQPELEAVQRGLLQEEDFGSNQNPGYKMLKIFLFGLLLFSIVWVQLQPFVSEKGFYYRVVSGGGWIGIRNHD